MSEVINPPDYYFPGINFNPAFYAEEAGGGLSQAIANTLYLRKTVPDTATAVETFTSDVIVGGAISVKDNLVSPTAIITLESSTSAPSIALASDTLGSMTLTANSLQVDTTKTLNIGTNTNVDLNIGTGARTGTGTVPNPYIVHNYSDGDGCLAGNGVHLNNGATNLSNTNIHNGISSVGQVNIMSGASSTGVVNVGITGTTTNLNGITKANGATGLTTLAITGPATSSTMTVGSNLTTGIMSLFTNSTASGTINMMNGGVSTGTVNVGNYNTSPSLTKTTTNIAGDVSVGSTGATTTILGTTNINTAATSSTSIGQSGTVTINGIINMNAGSQVGGITIGNETNGSTSLLSDTITVGNSGSTVTTNGLKIKQITPLLGGGTCEVSFGNADSVTSLSTVFNKKRTEPGAIGALADQDCYLIVTPGAYTSQYFEIVVCGSNGDRGGYSYKGCFIIETTASTTSGSSVSTLFYVCGFQPTSVPPVVTLAVAGNNVTLKVNTSSASSNQNFITTLTAYPTLTIGNTLFDFSVTAI